MRKQEFKRALILEQFTLDNFSINMDFGSPLLSPATRSLPENWAPPVADQDAIKFLSSIDPAEVSGLTYTDSLVTFSEQGKELGEFTICVEPTTRHSQDCYLIHANSHGMIAGVPCGTSIIAYVTASLQTLDQEHHEYVKLDSNPLDRKTFVQKDGETYTVSRIVTQGEEVSKNQRTYSSEQMQGFISEGANLLLQRLLARVGDWRAPHFNLLSLDSDVILCRTTYASLGEDTRAVVDQEMPVVGIERTIHSLLDKPTTWRAWYLTDGHLAYRLQVGSPVSMKLIGIPPYSQLEGALGVTKKPLEWESDLQMKSNFLDKKEQLKADHGVYMRRHPELKAILADFLQFLLLRKPRDVFAFAADYYASFCHKYPDNPLRAPPK